jgi:DNA repair photolyase
LNDGNFFDTVYYKKNILETLEKELSSPNWKREVINIGGVTDSYQPIEKELKIIKINSESTVFIIWIYFFTK